LVTRYQLNEVLQDLTISQQSPHKYEPRVTTGISDIRLTLKEPCSKSDDPGKRKRLAEGVINSVPDNCIKIFTDGSSDNSYLNGGSGAVIIQISEGAESTLSPNSGKLSSNFTGEVLAILSSIKEVLQMNIPLSHIVIYSDSQAAMRVRTDPEPKSVIICQKKEIFLELKKRSHNPVAMG